MRSILISMLLLCGSANAELYTRVDRTTGHVTYTNIPPEGTVEDLDPVPVRPMRVATRIYVPQKTKARSSAPASPAEFPKISSSSQKERDTDRRYILMSELEQETSALNKVQQQKADELTINRHKNNIAMLKREIQNIK